MVRQLGLHRMLRICATRLSMTTIGCLRHGLRLISGQAIQWARHLSLSWANANEKESLLEW
jgi:hypothetical protein